jgi:23S rRNA pseudouridine1911/1915/1917 synthase
MELPILYEDADIVAVDKPAGVMTHAPDASRSDASRGPTAEEWFKQTYPHVALERPYVHRLDRETSGVLVFAKNEVAWEMLRKAFTDREVHKTYLAVVLGVPKEKKGVIDFDIGRSRKDFRLRSAQPKAKGTLRSATTRYETVGETEQDGKKYALLALNPETGRTHQIRVHLKAIHHPVVGDPLYAPKSAPTLGMGRLALHAYKLDLPLPSGARREIVAPIPPDFMPALARFADARQRFAAL